jgi:class 3 adenylate cyclase
MPEQPVERRLAAIVAVDIVGYSRLMGGDEEGTHARLKDLRRELIDPEATSYRGRIVKTTGDGFLIEFQSVVDAFRYAETLQQGMAQRNEGVAEDQRMLLRIGLNVGEVIIDEGDVFGDGVNIAARLEQIAQPGGICVSDRAWRDLRRLPLAFDDLGEQTLKNIAEPVRAFAWRADGSTAPVAQPQVTVVVATGRGGGTARTALVAAVVAMAVMVVAATALGLFYFRAAPGARPEGQPLAAAAIAAPGPSTPSPAGASPATGTVPITAVPHGAPGYVPLPMPASLPAAAPIQPTVAGPVQPMPAVALSGSDYAAREAVARTTFRPAAAKSPTELMTLPSLLITTGRIGESRALLTQAVQRFPRSAPLQLLLANVDYSAGDLDGARRALAVVQQVQPGAGATLELRIALQRGGAADAQRLVAAMTDYSPAERQLFLDLFDGSQSQGSGGREATASGLVALSKNRNSAFIVEALVKLNHPGQAAVAAVRLHREHGDAAIPLMPLYAQSTASLRARPPIVAEFERMGLPAFWRASGKLPDFCRTTGASALCGGLR